MFEWTEFAFWTMILGGLALFLFGISSISKVLKTIASGKIRNVIQKFSNNRFKGFLVGTGFTALIQSSSGTSALAIGLVRAGIMTFVQGAAIIIGANVGTTITAFIVSIPVMEFFPLVLFAGSLILLLTTRKKYINFGNLMFALGCIFFGLWVMEMNLKTLKDAPWFLQLFEYLNMSPWLGLLIGIVATAAIQSSSAVIGIVQGLYAAALLGGGVDATLFGVLPILFGANIGTTVTALISSIGGSKESKKVALFHVLYNVSGSLIFMGIIYIPPLQNVLINSQTWVRPEDAKILLAVCHLIFNIVTAGVFLGLLTPICGLLNKLIPSENKNNNMAEIIELDPNIIKKFPQEGLGLAKQQLLTMFGYSTKMFSTINEYLDKNNAEDGDFIKNIEVSIDRIDRQLNGYLLLADRSVLSESDSKLLVSLMKACKEVERIGDYGENLITFYEDANERKEKIGEEYKKVFMNVNAKAEDLIRQTEKLFNSSNSKQDAIEVIQKRRTLVAEVDDIIGAYFNKYPEKESSSYVDLIFVDILNAYQRVFSHCSNIAKIFGTDKVYVHYSVQSEEERFKNLSNRY